MNKVQSAFWFQGLPTSHAFQREYEAQETLPIDGSRQDLRTYSPFIIRVLPPAILGGGDDNILSSGMNPQRGAGAGGTIRESNRDQVAYAATVHGVAQESDSYGSYQALVSAGGALPGLSSTSFTTIQARYNQALFAQVFGPAVQRSLNGTGTRPTATITPALTNDLTALSILYQVKQMLDTPPLLLLINPQSMTRQHAKIAQFQERTRMGYLYQAWGEELLKINFTFRIGAYVVGGRGQRGPSGVSRAGRRDSAAYQQLMAILSIFQNSGYIQDSVGHSKAHLMIGNIAIEYDQNVYIGHFDTFNLTEAEDAQNGGLQFDMDFTAIKVYDLSTPALQVQPMTSPANPYRARNQSRGSLVSGSTAGIQVLSAPSFGVSGSAIPPQPWAGATLTDEGVVPGVTNSRRRT